MNFGGGTMAHIEYTVTKIGSELSLNGVALKTIIEFDSDEMKPIQAREVKRHLPLAYSVDSILAISTESRSGAR